MCNICTLAINSYRSSRNSVKSLWCDIITNLRIWKSNYYNTRNRLVVGDPLFKIAKVSQPSLVELKKIKDYDTYYNIYLTTKENKLPIKNTVLLLKGAVNKIIKFHYEKTNQCVIHDVSLWASRYEDIIKNNSQIFMGNLNKNTIATFVNQIIFMQENFPISITRKDEISSYNSYHHKIKKHIDILNMAIYEIGGINKNATFNENQLQAIISRLTNNIEKFTAISNRI